MTRAVRWKNRLILPNLRKRRSYRPVRMALIGRRMAVLSRPMHPNVHRVGSTARPAFTRCRALQPRFVSRLLFEYPANDRFDEVDCMTVG
jgi:hypothetical protein